MDGLSGSSDEIADSNGVDTEAEVEQRHEELVSEGVQMAYRLKMLSLLIRSEKLSSKRKVKSGIVDDHDDNNDNNIDDHDERELNALLSEEREREKEEEIDMTALYESKILKKHKRTKRIEIDEKEDYSQLDYMQWTSRSM